MTEYSKKEETANIITHGAGVLLSIFFLILLIRQALEQGDFWHITSYTIFGASLVLLYSASTTYHLIKNPELKKYFRKVDHSAIYILIAGSYTPFLLVSLRSSIGWLLFGIVWVFALTGIIVKVFTQIKSKWASAIIYIIMGWQVVFAFRELIENVSSTSLYFLGLGGFFYTIGVFFYVWKKLLYHHAIWHLFVLGGSISHFLAIYYILQ